MSKEVDALRSSQGAQRIHTRTLPSAPSIRILTDGSLRSEPREVRKSIISRGLTGVVVSGRGGVQGKGGGGGVTPREIAGLKARLKT
jgi:hypothetical protein